VVFMISSGCVTGPFQLITLHPHAMASRAVFDRLGMVNWSKNTSNWFRKWDISLYGIG